MKTNSINWFEIPTRDMDKAVAFYETVLAVQLRREIFGGEPHAIFPIKSGGDKDHKGVTGALVLSPRLSPGAGVVLYLDAADGVLCAGNLKASGYQPEQVDEIYITHMHPDHIGGLASGGKMVFVNAVIRAAKAEGEQWLNQAAMDKAPAEAKDWFKGPMSSLNPYLVAGKYKPFEGKTELVYARPIRNHVAWFKFHRGFVEEIKIDAKRFLDTADELYRLAPIRKLSITGLLPVIDQFFASPHLGRIASLYVEYQHIGDAGVKLIAESPYLKKLAVLGLCGNDVTLAGVEFLAASQNLPSLKDIEFTGNPAGVVSEIVSNDILSPAVVFASGSEEAYRIEQIYGRKTWLHTVEDHGFRIPLMIAEC